MVFILWIWVFFCACLLVGDLSLVESQLNLLAFSMLVVCPAVEVKLLLAAGATVNKENGDSWTPLFSAARYGHVDVMKLLLDAGAEVGIGQSQNRETKSRTTVQHRSWGVPTHIQFL